MKTVLTLAAVTIGLLSAVACAKKDDARSTSPATSDVTTLSASLQPKAACNMQASLGTCNEYRTGTSFGLERTVCDGFKGKFGSGACPAEGRIARCELGNGEIRRYYGKDSGEHGLSLADAQADCESDLVKGRFSRDAI